jgi:hypothetical protein
MVVRVEKRTNTNKLPLALVAVEGNRVIGTVCLKKYGVYGVKSSIFNICDVR